MKTKKQKKLVALLALLVVAVLGATFAYFNQTLTAENPFDTGKYDSTLTEDFDPSKGENWEPNATVNKNVAVDNTGDYPIVVRVKFEDLWVNKDSGEEIYKSAIGRDGTTGQLDDSDGLTPAGDTSVVQLLFNGTDGAADGWTYSDPAAGGDGYWYFNDIIPAGESTEEFLTAVKLIENADMGVYEVKKYYTKADTKPAKDKIGSDPTKEWVEYTGEVPNGSKHNMTTTNQTKAGYSGANYTLKITAQTVQATKAAAADAFKTGIPANVVTSWDLK